MTGPTPPAPGERRLDRPPSDRYRVAEPEATLPDSAASRGRGVAFGAVASIVGAAAITLLGGILAITAGLVVAAAATGWAVGTGVRAGGGSHLTPRGRFQTATALALAAIALAQLGLWVHARSEGGVLAPLDYLWEVYGGLVPLEFVAAAVATWIASR